MAANNKFKIMGTSNSKDITDDCNINMEASTEFVIVNKKMKKENQDRKATCLQGCCTKFNAQIWTKNRKRVREFSN